MNETSSFLQKLLSGNEKCDDTAAATADDDDADGQHGPCAGDTKTGIPCKRIGDLELINTECLWLELNRRNKKILVGTFYRPLNSTPLVLNEIENSIGLVVDTGITDIVILGDFNLKMLNTKSEGKITALCQQYSFKEHINEPINYTENTSTITDLIMVNAIY